MQVAYPELLGDLGDQVPAAELTLGIRGLVDDHPSRLDRKAEVINLPEFEYVSPAELLEELVGFKTVSPDVERRMRNELGPDRFSGLMRLFFRLWQADRMI